MMGAKKKIRMLENQRVFNENQQLHRRLKSLHSDIDSNNLERSWQLNHSKILRTMSRCKWMEPKRIVSGFDSSA